MNRWLIATATALAMGTVAVVSVTAMRASHMTPWRQEGPRISATTVAVTRGSITQVTVLPAQIVSEPNYYLLAKTTGRLRLDLHSGRGVEIQGRQRLGTVGTTPVVGQASATVVRALVPDGSMVTAGVPLVELMYAGFAETAQVPPEDAYHVLDQVLSARADITSGPGPFNCPLVQQAEDGSSDTAVAQAGVPVLCLIPSYVHAYQGLTGSVAIRTGLAHDVLVLPVTSVSGTTQLGEVMVIDHGKAKAQQVTLGVSDGSMIEIDSGLREGEDVSSQAPDFFQQTP